MAEEISREYIRKEFETTGISLKELAVKHQINYQTLKSWKSREKWQKGATATSEVATKVAPISPSVKGAAIALIRSREPELLSGEEIDDDGLTPKMQIFVREYVRDFNATRAAMAAGYSKKTAYSIGWELLRKPEIQAAKGKYIGLVMEEVGMNAQRVLMEYMKIAFTDITDVLEFGQREVPVMTMFGPMYEGEGEEKKPVTKVVNFVDFKESDIIDGTVISEVKQGKDGVSIKLYDKMKALEVLTKYIDLLPDTHRRMIAEEKLKLDRERLEFDKAKDAGDSDSDEDIIEGWARAVVDDEEGLSGDEEATSSIQEEGS